MCRLWWLGVLAVTGCGDVPAPPVGTTPVEVRVAIGGQGLLVYLPTTLAAELGYYREEGLHVTIQDFAGGSRALQALMGGSVDVVSGYFDHTIQMAAAGRRLVAFVTLLRYPGLVAVVSPSARQTIASIGDLPGAMVGVTSPGSSTHFFVNHLLATHGLSPDAISVTGIGSTATAVAAMERGMVDVGILLDPAVTELAARSPDLRILADTRTVEGVREVFGTDVYPAAVLYAPESWTTAHRDTAARLARAMTRTLAWIQTHSGEEIMRAMPERMRGDDPARYLVALERTLPMYSPDGRMSSEGAAAVERVLSLSIPAVREADVDISATYTNAFVEPR